MSAAEEPSTGGLEDHDDPSAEALVGRVLNGKVRIDAVLGRGAMGFVYRATHTTLEKTVAVKVIKPSLSADEMFRARFLREALVASRLDHPNSVQVLDYGTEPDGVTYIVMEFLKGRTLGDAMATEGRMAVGRIVEVMSQVLGALSVAHGLGIVHRDLKPENVMLVPRRDDDDEGPTGEVVKVMDFGVATSAEGAQGRIAQKLTTADVIMGTPGYMSPEQLRGEKLDGRSDLYACGVMLFEMVTGNSPFEAETLIDMAFAHISQPVPSIADRVPGIDPRVEAVIHRAMEKERFKRFDDARAMRAALRALMLEPGAEPRPSMIAPGQSTFPGPGTGASMPVRAVAPTTGPSVPAAVTQRASEETNKVTPAGAGARTRAVFVGVGLAALTAVVALAMMRRGPGENHAQVDAPPRAVHTAGPAPVVPPVPPMPIAPPPVPTPVVTAPVGGAVEPTTAPVLAHPIAPVHGHPVPRHGGTETVATPAPIEVTPTPAPVVVAPTPVVVAPTPVPVPVPVVTPTAPPRPALARGASATLANLDTSGGAPRGPLQGRGMRAAQAFGQCASREIAARGAASGFDASTRPLRVRVVMAVRDERLDELHIQGGPPWLASCANVVRENFAGALPAADDTEYSVTLDVTLAPVP